MAFGTIVLASCASGDVADSTSPGATSQAQFHDLAADWSQRYVECARSFGADASINRYGSIVNPVAPGRPSTNGLDTGCLEEVGPEPSAPPATREFLQGLYTLFVDQAKCLRDAGYVISEPPSQGVWVENYSGESWNPLTDVFRAGLDVETADRLCPQPDPVEAERVGSQE